MPLRTMPTAPPSVTIWLDASIERVRGGDPMTSDTLLSRVLGGETETDIDAFVAAVIRTHERMQRNIWRLATERIWPAASEARADCQLLEVSRLGK